MIVISLSIMITLTFVNVVLRGLYTHAHMQWANSILSMADWGDPIARLMVLWLTFLGASLITSENRHINIDFISSLLPEKWLFLHKAILSTASALICGFMLYGSINYIKIEFDYGSYFFLKVPSWACQIIIPAGFGMILFRFIINAVDQLFSQNKGSK